MTAQAWHDRWREGRIGFHRNEVNPRLVEHWPALPVDAGAGVLVPLCGKAVDMHWLAGRGCRVVGVELSPIAVGDFFAAAGLDAQRGEHAGFEFLEHGAIRIYCGDFFALTRAHLGDVSACFDRAALIALPPAERKRYMQHLATLLPAGSECLLVALDYPQQEMSGPPFSVPADEVGKLSADHFALANLADEDVLANETKFRERGVTRMREQCYRLTRLAGD